MKNTEQTRTVTVSFKTTTQEMIAIQQIANEKNITRSEFIASIVSEYKYHYDYIGKVSPKEEQLQSKLENVRKQNRKLNLALENADTRIDMDMKARRKLIDENLKLNKTIFNLEEKLKILQSENKRLLFDLTDKKDNRNIYKDEDAIFRYGSLISAVLTGVALFVSPVVFRK